jgi:polyisoprenyl-phosphate glycosyltransferase
MNFDISVICPVYNEASNIKKLYERIKKSIPDKYTSEIIFINDGSKDKSEDIIKEICLVDNNVCLVSFTKNYGHQIALTAGYDYAVGKCVISLDSDLQHPPELINKMVSEWENGCKVVLTKRLNKNLKFIKRVTSKLFYSVFRKLSNIDIVDNSADFRLLDMEVVKSMQNYKESTRFIRGIIADMNYKYIILEYEEEKRHSGNTKYNFLKMLSFALKGILSFSNAPLRLSIYFGLLISFFCLLYTFWLIYYKVVYGNVAWMASVLVGIFFLGGVQLISLGILGEYVANIFTEVKHRPLYCIDKVIRNNNENIFDRN